MPDRSWETISASQSAALFGHSPYCTKWLLWQAFRAKDASLIEPPESERMRLGKLYELAILSRTADDHRLEIEPNVGNEYVRRGNLGCTRDAFMVAPDLGRMIVEAKRVNWLRWRDTWTETAAPMHVEIQLQHQLLVEDCQHGIIACDNGDDAMLYYRREANPEIHERLIEESRLFFESLAAGKEPDPLGSPIEIPALAALYPTSDPTEVLEDLDDEALSDAIREFAYFREQESFAKKRAEAAKAILLARAGTAGIVRARGVRCFIKKTEVAPQLCEPHDEPKEVKRGFIQTRITVEQIEETAREASGAWAA
jgi:predicted phage-related endonuclease